MKKAILILVAGVLVIFGVISANIEKEFEENHENQENLISEKDNKNSIEEDNNLYNKETEEIDNQKEEDQQKEEEVEYQINERDKVSFIDCLADAGVVIYGSNTCPACAKLSEEYGGYEKMGPIYVECSEEWERCSKEMLVGYVPAVQINGKLFNGWGSPENLAKETGCDI